MTVTAGFTGAAVLCVVMFEAVGAAVLERANPLTLALAGSALAGLIVFVVREVQPRGGHTDLDRELRRLLEEEARKPQ